MREITYKEAVREAMCEEMRKDENVFLLGEDVGVYGGAFGVSDGMVDEFGENRVIDAPISELGQAGVGVGAAVVGMRPIIEFMFSDFMMLALDQIANQGAKMRYMFGGTATVPVVYRTPAGCGTGAAAQHSQSPEAWVTNFPGVKVVAPSTAYDAKGLLKTSIRDNNTVIFLEQKVLYKTKGEVPEEEYTIPLGKADIKKAGKDVTVVTYGRMVPLCLTVAEKLKAEGIELEVVDLRTLVPMDKDCVVESIKKTHRALIVHEACKTGGFGGEIVATINESDAFHYLDAPVLRCAGEDVPIPYCKHLEHEVVPTEEKIIAAVRKLMK